RPFLRSEWSSEIRNAHQLQLMAMRLDVHYRLLRDIDFTAIFDPDDWNKSGMWSERGFVPIGDNASAFTGHFDGGRHVINGLYIHRPMLDFIGLFSKVESGGVIERVGLEGARITGRENVAALVGLSDGGFVKQTYSTGFVEGSVSI